MTALGKILVFINLLFSLVVAALIIMVFIARTTWSENAKNWKSAYEAANASANAAIGERDAVKTEYERKYQEDKGAVDKEVAALKEENNKLKEDKGKLEAELNK